MEARMWVTTRQSIEDEDNRTQHTVIARGRMDVPEREGGSFYPWKVTVIFESALTAPEAPPPSMIPCHFGAEMIADFAFEEESN